MKGFYVISVILLCILVSVLWQQSQIKEKSDPVPLMDFSAVTEPIQPIPVHIELNEKKVELGEKLFHDPRLSHDNSVSCASCHKLSLGGIDRMPRSIGIKGHVTSVNAPTVFNSGFNFRQFWDGRAETLEDQIGEPINSAYEMGSNWAEVLSKLRKASDYVSAFGELYPDGIKSHNIKDAIATFVRSLYTPHSRFDRFLRGDGNALTNEEKEGYRIFKAYGCVSCHQGINVGGNMFQKFGIMADYFADHGKVTKADLGRYNVTGEEQDRQVFKVPSLRNVALTPPYFHDGSAKTLEAAVAVMAKYQLGRKLTSKEIDLIVKFLSTLTGEYRGKRL